MTAYGITMIFKPIFNIYMTVVADYKSDLYVFCVSSVNSNCDVDICFYLFIYRKRKIPILCPVNREDLLRHWV